MTGQSRHATSPKRRGQNPLRLYAPTLIAIVLLFLAWQVLQSRGGVTQYILPTPLTIAKSLFADRHLILRNMGVTLSEALGGFLLGNGLAILAAVLFVYSRSIEESFYGLAVVLQSIPIVAITPLLILLFGPGYLSKVVLVVLITFFPTLVNMVQGLLDVEESARELLHTLSANEWQFFWKVRLPSSLPYLFAALKIAPAASILGAIIAEWMGSTAGLGYLIVQAMYEFRVGRLWATMAVVAFLSLAAYVVVYLLERIAVPWHSSVREAAVTEELR